MKHDDIDDLLAHGLRDYNAPPAVPREELWQRIAAARAGAAGESTARSATGLDSRARRGDGRPRTTWTTIAIAASLLLAAGIGVGRWIERRPDTAPVVASRPVGPAHADTLEAPPTVEPTQQLAAVSPNESPSGATPRERATGLEASPNRGAAASAAATTGRGGPARRGTTADNLAYRLVVLQHLAGSEAMITAFRTSARTGEVDPEVARWSRDLLSTTRLLEASQAADDPVMKRLLGDLDLIITQIVQYSARDTVDTEELDLIEHSINQRGIITKLRGTLPGRISPAGS